MFEKPTSLNTLGIEREGDTLKAVQLTVQRSEPSLVRLYVVTLDTQLTSANSVNPLDISEDGKQLHEALNKNLVVAALPAEEVLIRPLDIKLKKDRDIDAVLAFQTEPLLPYPIESALLNRITTSTNSEGTQLNVLAARKDHVEAFLEGWRSLQIDPEVVTSVPAALALFGKIFLPSPEPQFIVHTGQKQTTCVLVKEGKLLAAQASEIGLEAIQADTNGAEHWRLEMTRILYALAKQRKEQDVTGILFTGEGATNHNLTHSLCQSTSKIELLPLEKFLFPVALEQLQKFAVPIGAALSGLPSQEQVNFRQQEHAYPHPWKRLIRPLALYFALCVSFAGAFYLFGESYLGYKEDGLREKYVELLTATNKSYPGFEKLFASKNPHLTNGDSVLPVKSLTSSDIAGRLQFLQKEMQGGPDLFPLQPNVPLVSDVLAWLSTHAIFAGAKAPAEGSNNEIAGLQLENFNYTLIKRPEPKKTQEKYQAKVELEFSSPTPKLAREFHDSLIAPNEMVDPKGEVKWSSNKGHFRASFFLKDKTVYP